MRHLLLILIVIAACGGVTMAEKTTRRGLKAVAESVATVACDTLSSSDLGLIAVSGYDKPLRSRHETFFVTNGTDSTIGALKLRIEYRDMSGRSMHNREDSIACCLLPGETRNFSIRSWDRQCSFYYEWSAPPRRSTSATPYRVAVTIDKAYVFPSTQTKK